MDYDRDEHKDELLELEIEEYLTELEPDGTPARKDPIEDVSAPVQNDDQAFDAALKELLEIEDAPEASEEAAASDDQNVPEASGSSEASEVSEASDIPEEPSGQDEVEAGHEAEAADERMAALEALPSDIELVFPETLDFELPVSETSVSDNDKEEAVAAVSEAAAGAAIGTAAGAAALAAQEASADSPSPSEAAQETTGETAETDNSMKKKSKKQKKKKKKGVKGVLLRIILALFILGMLGVIACVGFAGYIIYHAEEIDPSNIYATVAESSTIYDDAGTEMETIFYTENRKFSSYSEIPENLIDAVIALEDKTFWEHHGFNWTRMVGAVISSITGHGQISGTSTITQQLARNVYLPDTKSDRDIRRKITEMYYAFQIERTLSKEQIIEAYLNTIYLGFGSYGIESAADSYFHKSVSDLNLIECASLAALPQAPNDYALVVYVPDGTALDKDAQIIMTNPDTYIANDVSKDRRQLCLDLMLEQGYITEKQHDKIYEKDLIDFINPHISSNNNTNAYFVDYLLDQVCEDLAEKYEITEDAARDMIYTGGLQIYSTLDTTAQKVVVNEFNDSSNYPALTGYYTDENNNIISPSGLILLYDYDYFFNEKGNFKLKKNECTINSDGSLTIKRDERLNIYTTEAGGVIDYSLEFKKTYEMEDGILYIHNGGYINIPSTYKSLDEDDNLVISADYFKDYEGAIKLGESTATITPKAYTLAAKTIQPQSAMVIVEIGTGQVKAMVGGRKQSGKQLYNRATNPRQPGSSIKPLAVYGAALQKSFEYAEAGQTFPFHDTGHDKQGKKWWGSYLTASSAVVDEKMTFSGKTWPSNSTNSYSGYMTVRKALQQSVNTCAVKIQLQVGDTYSADLVEKFGITTLVRDGKISDMNSAALALGGLTNGVTALEMAQAYATFPNGGVRQTSIAYTKVVDRNGDIVLEGNSESVKVLDKGVAWIMTDMLKSVVSQGIGSNARTYEVASGGKTGTTSNQYDIWFDGFTPSYAAALWIGTDVNIPLTSMSGTAAALWGNIMNQIPAAMKGEYKGQPDNVVYVAGEYYTEGTEKGRSTYIAEMEAKKKAEEERKRREEEERKKKEEEAKKKAEEAKKKAEQLQRSNQKNKNNNKKKS